ncbi:MAG: serine/threonine-protein kinase [Acidobacteriota bacterium]
MNPQRWQQIEAIFQTAVDYEPNQRAGYLTQACSGDQELRAEVESLLAQELADTFMQAQIKGVAQMITAEPQDLVGKHVGVYRVASLIGEGGMGAVYAAVRVDQQFDQQVALKVVKRGMDSAFVLNRFRRERQILARLEHPHIARLIDGGTTSDGRPYFVMEFVEGQSITQYCAEKELSVVERLKLFRQVCAAVQYAHQQLVVHRDLKPSNILVASGGLPKLLDFGIAKVLQPDDSQAEATMTATSLRLMTPDYASPEQARGQSISAATDVYSLGVVLYELLTGERPHRFQSYTPTEIERVICEAEVARPSAAVTNSKTEGLAKWRRQLAGDLDNIVLMALRKEPERRYNSVEQFSEDLRRHLEGQPVIARQDTFGYRTGKFVRRHKLGVAATALIMLSLISGLGIARYQARRAERRFQQVRELANTFLFDFHDQIKNLPGSTKARELVVSTALKYLDSLAQEASGDATLEWELAEAYQKVGDVQGDPWAPSLGHSDEARRSYEKASALSQKLAARNQSDLKIQRALARNYFKIGTLLAETGDKDNSQGWLRRSLAISEQVAQRSGEQIDGTYLCDCYVRLGDVYLDTGDARGGLEFYQKSLAISQQLAWKFKDDRTLAGVAIDHSHVGEALASTGDLANAIEHYRQAQLIDEELTQRNPNNNFYKRSLQLNDNWLGNLYGNPSYVNAGDPLTAVQYYRQSLAIAEEIAAADPKDARAQMDLVTSCNALGDLLADSNPGESARQYQRALLLLETLLAGAPDELRFLRRRAYTLRGSATPLRRLGEREMALNRVRQSLQTMRQLSFHYPANPQVRSGLLASLLALAGALTDAGEYDAALEHYREAQALAEALAAAARSDVYARWRLADVYAGLGKYYESLAVAPKTAIAQRRQQGNEACAWRHKSLEVWDGWTQYGVSSVFNTTKREQAARALANCETRLAQLSNATPR